MAPTPSVAVAPGPPARVAVRAPVPRRRLWLRRAFLGGLLVFAAGASARYRHDLGPAVRALAWWTVPAALAAALAAMVAALGVWRALMRDLGVALSWRTAARIFYLSQLGKYAPGGVWSIAVQSGLGRAHRIPGRVSVTVGVLAIAVSVTVGLSLAVLVVPFAGPATARGYWWVPLILPALVAGLHPAVLGRILGRALRSARRQPLARTPSAGGLARAAAWQGAVWLLLGLHLWLLLVGAGAPALGALPLAVGGYPLAYGLGQLAVGLPAGAGVRETALVVVLSTVVSAPVALLAALVSRAILTVVDVAMAGTQGLLARR